MILQKIWSYITFKKQPEFRDQDSLDTNGQGADEASGNEKKYDGSYLKMMHGINRISIIMFLIGMIIVLIKIFK
jgi:hypothetical protein